VSERANYCRACGTDKGHDFPACKNARGLRAVIKSQDAEIRGLTETVGSLRKQVALAEEESARNRNWQKSSAFLERVINALLDARKGGER
jgi:hypothetical protein